MAVKHTMWNERVRLVLLDWLSEVWYEDGIPATPQKMALLLAMKMQRDKNTFLERDNG